MSSFITHLDRLFALNIKTCYQLTEKTCMSYNQFGICLVLRVGFLSGRITIIPQVKFIIFFI